MVRQDDLGGEVVRRIRVRLDRGQGSSDWHRGFVWQPLGATQRIWSEPSAALGRASAWRIQVRTEFPGLDGPSPRMVSMEAPLTALSAVVRSIDDRARLELASTLHVHAGNEGWAPQLIAFVARLQATDVRRIIRDLSMAASSAVVETSGLLCRHPRRRITDDTHAAPPAAAPLPKTLYQDSPWTTDDQAECLSVLHSLRNVTATFSPNGVVGHISCPNGPCGHGLSELTIGVVTDDRLGPGLAMLLTMPGPATSRDAIALNEAELGTDCHTDLLGNWFVHQGVLQHASFFPDATYAEGLALHATLGAARRVDWVCGRPGSVLS